MTIGTPLRSPLGAYIRTPGLARETEAAEELSEFLCRAKLLGGFNDRRSRWDDGITQCAQAQEVSNFWAGQTSRDRQFLVFRDGQLTPPSPAMVDMLTWRLVGQTSGAVLLVGAQAPVTDCDAFPAPGALESGHYRSAAGQTGPGESEVYYTYDLKLETYTGGSDESNPAGLIHPIWNGSPAGDPPFIDNELCDIFVPAP